MKTVSGSYVYTSANLCVSYVAMRCVISCMLYFLHIQLNLQQEFMGMYSNIFFTYPHSLFIWSTFIHTCMHCKCKYHETCTLVYLNIWLMSAWNRNAYITYKCSKWEWRQTTGLSMRPTQKSLELCLHLWDRNRSASWIWNQKPPDVSGRCLPTSLATLPPARQSDIVQNMQQNRSSGFRYWSPKRVVEIRLKRHQPNFWTVGFRPLEY